MAPVQKAVVLAVADAIKELGVVPAGHLYANLMGHLNLEEFESIISILVKSGVVRRDGSHLLTWTEAR